MQSERFAVVNFETTGFHAHRGDRAVEIGIILIENGKIRDSFTRRIHTSVRSSPLAYELHHITVEMLEDAPSAESVMREALAFSDGAVLVAHNRKFESAFWHSELEHEQIVVKPSPFVCTLMLAKHVFPALSKLNHQAICKHFNIAEGNHRSLDEAKSAAEIFLKSVTELKSLYPDRTIDSEFLLKFQSGKELPEELDKAQEPFDVTNAPPKLVDINATVFPADFQKNDAPPGEMQNGEVQQNAAIESVTQSCMCPVCRMNYIIPVDTTDLENGVVYKNWVPKDNSEPEYLLDIFSCEACASELAVTAQIVSGSEIFVRVRDSKREEHLLGKKTDLES